MSTFVLMNIVDYLNPGKPPADTAFTITSWVVMVMLALQQWVEKKRHPNQMLSTRLEMGFHLYNLLSVFVMSLLLYIMGSWGAYRVIGVHLLLTLVLAYLILNLLSVFAFNSSLVTLNDFRFHPAVRPDTQLLEPYLAFDRETQNPWCNSILIDFPLHGPLNLAVPGGIGLSFHLGLEESAYRNLRSRYLWLDDTTYQTVLTALDLPELPRAVPAELNLPIYLNPNAAC